MISRSNKKQIAQKLSEMWSRAPSEVKKLMEDQAMVRQCTAMIDHLKKYKDAFVRAYKQTLDHLDPDWKNSKILNELVASADKEACRSECGSPKILTLLLKAAHQDLGISLGFQSGHYRLAKKDYEPVTDDVLEEMFHVCLMEASKKEGG